MVTYGPYVALSAGEYSFKLYYSADSPGTQDIAWWDIVSDDENGFVTFDSGGVTGTDGKLIQREYPFELTVGDDLNKIQFRLFSLGTSVIKIQKKELVAISGSR